MTQSNGIGLVVVTLGEGSVQLQLPGELVVVPITNKSALLREAISAANGEEHVSLSLPKGVLQCWLESMEALAVGSAQECNSVGSDPLLDYLTVCYLDICLALHVQLSVLTVSLVTGSLVLCAKPPIVFPTDPLQSLVY